MIFRFGNPDMLHLYWLLPVLVGLSLWYQRRGELRLKQTLGDKLTPFLAGSLNLRKRRLKLSLKVLSMAFFIFALARPQLGASLEEIKSEGVEMILAVDVSRSMLAEDVRPSRLEFAKKELSRLMDLLAGDKVGLIAFAGSAILLSPMTTDKSALKMYLNSLSTESVATQGTDVSKALREAEDGFERGGVETDNKSRVTRVILLASDGEDHEQGAIDLAGKLLDKGVRIFAYAFGTEKGAPIPVVDSRGRRRGFKKDKEKKVVYSKTKGTFLRDLAKAGRGSFYHARFGGNAAQRIFDDISKLEKAEFDALYSTNYDEKYQIFLFLGFLCALLDLFLGERRPLGRIWKGRFEVAES